MSSELVEAGPLSSTITTADDLDIATFSRLLFAGPGAEPLKGTPDDVLRAEAGATLALVRQRQPGRPLIRMRPHQREHGLTVLEIVNDDMPFLVDTVIGELTAQGLTARLVLHPIMKVWRGADLRVASVLGRGDRDWADGNQDSVMVVHLEALAAERTEALEHGLQVALDDVRRATGDWRLMLEAIDRQIADITQRPPGVSAAALAETLAFCRWLRDDRFTFLGARTHTLSDHSGAAELVPVTGSSLGVLRDASLHILAQGEEPVALTPRPIEPATAVATASGLLSIATSSITSRVHRRKLMDEIAIARFDETGRLAGDVRFVGLFTSKAYTAPVREIPVLRQRAAAVMEASGLPPESHAGKTLANVLETMPREELFQLTVPELEAYAQAMLDLDLRPRVRLLARRDQYGRYISMLLFIPRDRLTTTMRERIERQIEEATGGTVTSFSPYFTEGPLVRVHFVVATVGPVRPFELTLLERQIDETSRSWDERLWEQMAAGGGARPQSSYAGAFSAGYMETFGPERAIEDVARIERLTAERPIAIDFYRDKTDAGQAPTRRVRAAIYRFGPPIPLAERVPVLENMGLAAIDERSFRVTPRTADEIRLVSLHDMVLSSADGQPIDLERHELRMEAAYLAVERKAADNDPFNRLIVSAGADWREAMVMRALAAYMRQIRSPFGPRYIADTLDRHGGITRDLIELFRARHDPDLSVADPAGRQALTDRILARLEGALGGVASLDEDRILRALVNLIMATLRTNFFQAGPDGAPPATLAVKFDPKAIDGLPAPRPYREIFVYSPRVEGVHLRFGPIARGGLRWSDRAQDFRTEVLGLCKAQQVKNTVIVPTGSKGGFLPKHLPRSGSRDEVIAEGIAAYRLFVSSLLDITDDIRDGAIVPPPRTVRHDGDDPYLVVAADKGTATFSDFANEIATSRGFWLGDAFASGGSAGYDHKKMAITARGGWECVKRHFREMDWDIQTTPFRVTGVGDMSGDVFGNAMLLSPVIRLVAAFDHRDIFLDPDPDPATSFAERKRLFDLPRSSWGDYDRTKISAGGGVFSRQAKSIALAPEAQRVLGIEKSTVTPHDLMRAILLADTDLLWFGGIGTYIRATSETDEEVGDRANDAIRVTGAELRVKVIGEGANLGLTQRGRMEFAAKGGRLNTDFIDNSAGVNSSDQEVNIKIALGAAIAAGKLEARDRNALLASMTGDVAAACLVNNTQQSLALSLAERRSARDLGRLAEMMFELERQGLLDRALEALPSKREIAAREAAKAGMSRPELAVLLSWSKIALNADLMQTGVPRDPATQSLLVEYFPPALRTRFADVLAHHRLAPEIVATRVTNSIINRGGPTFVWQLANETGRSTAEIAYAYLGVRAIFQLPELWRDIDALDTQIPGALQLELYARTQDTLLAETASLLRSGTDQTLAEMIDRHTPVASQLPGVLASVLTDTQHATFETERIRLTAGGVPAQIAIRIAALPAMGRVIAIARLIRESGRSLEEAARCQFAADAWIGLTALEARTSEIAVGDYYDRLALTSALGAFEAASTRLALAALAAPTGTPGDHLAAHIASRGLGLARFKAALDAVVATPDLTVSRIVVASGLVRDTVG